MPRILVIDDDENICQMFEKLLTRAGYEVETALNGKEGTRLCIKHPFDLIMTDIFMPEKDGLETILELRKKFPDIKLVAVSGGDNTQTLDYLYVARKMGADYTFSKPVDDKKLLQVIGELISMN